jgi:hypothetical protein
MPESVAPELITYCIDSTALTGRSDELLRMLISVLGELPVQMAHIVAAEGGPLRHGVVVVDAEDAEALTALFPDAVPLPRSPTGTSAFRISGSRVSPR